MAVINIAAGASVQQIENAINGAEPGSIIQLAAGTYYFDRQLLITRDDIELRGMGSGETIIQAKFAEGEIDNLIAVQGSVGGHFELTQDVSQGSNVITVNDSSRFNVGDVLQVRQANDAEYMATLGDGSYNSGGYLRDSLARVAQVSGNQIILEHDLEFDFAAGAAQVRKLNMAENVKLGQFTISYEDALGIADDGSLSNTRPEYSVWGHNAALRLDHTANAQLSDIEIKEAGSVAFWFTTSLEIQGSQLVADGAHNKGGGGNGDAYLYGGVHHSEFTDIQDYGMRHGVTTFGHMSSTHNRFEVSFTDTNIDWHGGSDHDNTVIVEKSILLRGRDWDSWAVQTNTKGGLSNAPGDPDANDTLFKYLIAGKQAEEVYAVDDGAMIIAGANDDTIHGGLGDDTLQGGDYELRYATDYDYIDGGAGIDTAVFAGNRSDYTIKMSDGKVYVTDSVAKRDFTDTLENIELLKFADQTLTVPDLKVYVPPVAGQQDDDTTTDSGGQSPDTTTTEDSTQPTDDETGDGSGTQTDDATTPVSEPSAPFTGSVIMVGFDGETSTGFNGIDQFAEVAHSSDYLLDNGTINLSFMADDIDRSQGLLSKDSFGYDTGGHISIMVENGRLVLRLQSVDANYVLKTDVGSVKADTWHVTTVNWGSGGLTLYLDGELVGANSYTGGLGTTSGGQGNFAPLIVGAWSGKAEDFSSDGVSRYFGGEIADVAIFDQALAPWEIESINLAETDTPDDAAPTDTPADAAPTDTPADAVPTTTPDTIADLVMWLDADDAATRTDNGNDGDLDLWADKSGQGNDASQVTAVSQPQIVVEGINGRTAIEFDGVNDQLEVADAATVNTGSNYDGKTLMMAFRTGDDVTSRQVLFEQGGQTRGLNFYIDDGEIYLNGWNLAETKWGPSFASNTIEANTTYVATFVFDQAAGAIEGYIDGNSIGSISGVDHLYRHSQDIGIGSVNNSTRFHDGAFNGDGHYFDGLIGEFAQYNRALTEDEQASVETYLQDRWQNETNPQPVAVIDHNDDQASDQVATESDAQATQVDDAASGTDDGYTQTEGLLVVTNAEKAGHITVHNFDNLSGGSSTEEAGDHDVINLKSMFDELGGVYVDGVNDPDDRANAIILNQTDLDADGAVDDVLLTIDGVSEFSIALVDPSTPWPEVFGIGNGDGDFDDIWV